ncbi:MAG: GNAT family N-acetyltransferase, partial [Pseudorhodoplanes sp.]
MSLLAMNPSEPASPSTVLRDYPVDLPKKCDASAIALCFQEVYGESYVHSEVFSPDRYWAKVESGEVIPVVARGDDGEVIGHVALEREPGALVAERGEAVVLPAYRGHHLLERMTERLSIEAPNRGLHGIYAEPLTVHTFSQRNDVRAGMPVCAVLLGANPENFRPKDMS